MADGIIAWLRPVGDWMIADRSPLSRALTALLALLLLAAAVGPLLLPIRDPDLFWHLKNGEWVWQHRALPGEFVGAAVPQAAPVENQRFTRTSYWLAQVGLHLAHAAGGMSGIVAVRVLLFGLLLLALWRSVAGSGRAGLGLLLLAACVLSGFPPERPQYLSFLFAALLLHLLEGFRTAPTPAALRALTLAVPLLMLLWANCHGGYIVGLGFVGLVILGESIKRLDSRMHPLPVFRWRLLVGSGVAALLLSFANPNGGHVFRFAVLPDWQRAFIAEYQSTIHVYRHTSDSALIVAYWILLAIAVAVTALAWRRPDPSAIALTAVTGWLSFTQYRLLPFFVIAALPATCRALGTIRPARPVRALIVAAGIAAAALFLTATGSRYLRGAPLGEIDRVLFPVEAADLIEREGLRGNVFGTYDWGGYLLWRLAPAKVFIDGRNLDPDLLRDYAAILTGDRAEVGTLRQDRFGAAGIRLAVIDYYDPHTGELRGLVDDLIADPDWEPVYASPKAVVFAQAIGENRETIRSIAIPKREFALQLLEYCSGFIAAMPGFLPPRVARGDLLYRLGDREGALRSWREALLLAPDHRPARERVERLSTP